MNSGWDIILFSALLFVILLIQRDRLVDKKRLRDLGQLNVKLDFLLKQLGIEYPPSGGLPGELIDALQRGDKIKAIKYYRETTGVGLKEAKEFIEAVQLRPGIGEEIEEQLNAKLDLLLKHAGIEYAPYKNLPGRVVDALERGNKIEAIKHYREAAGVSLKEAKERIEAAQQQAGTGG